MKITKYGHCCLLIEDKEVRVLTDPGSYTTVQNELKNIDVVLITHEHGDHFHIESVKNILKNNPEVLIVTNTSVNELLKKENILNTKIVEDGESFEYKGIVLNGHGKDHVEIYKNISTGYFIGERLYYPGDAFFNPGKQVEILLLPVQGPWCRVKDSIEFTLDLKPKIAIPVHDGQLNNFGLNSIYKGAISVVLPENNIKFIPLELNKETEF
jgi:L-ascorbate metabolism protein UlaG (beta-lactamase superfamily)